MPSPILYPKSGKCPFCKTELNFHKDERKGNKNIKCPICEAEYPIAKVDFTTQKSKASDKEKTPKTTTKSNKITTWMGIAIALLVITSAYYFGFIGGGIAGGISWLIEKSEGSETTKIVIIVIIWLAIAFIGYSLTESISQYQY